MDKSIHNIEIRLTRNPRDLENTIIIDGTDVTGFINGLKLTAGYGDCPELILSCNPLSTNIITCKGNVFPSVKFVEGYPQIIKKAIYEALLPEFGFVSDDNGKEGDE